MKSPRITWINSDDPPAAFPDINAASDLPYGLLAAGGDLSEGRLLYAYSHGIFPWFNDDQPILWWSPDPRCVIDPGKFHISRRLRRAFRQSNFEVSFNTAFAEVIARCAEDRPAQDGTWITAAMSEAYRALHANGWAHSIEIRSAGELVGGLYGLAIDRVFFGESMFTRETNASKAAMLALCSVLSAHNFALLDCQVESPHLLSLGAMLMPRCEFAAILQQSCTEYRPFRQWPAKAQKINDFEALKAPDTLQ